MKGLKYFKGLFGVIIWIIALTMLWEGKALALSISQSSINLTASVPDDGSEQVYSYDVSFWDAVDSRGNEGITWSTDVPWIDVDVVWLDPFDYSYGIIKVYIRVSERFFPQKQGVFTGTIEVRETDGGDVKTINVTLTLLKSSTSLQVSPSNITITLPSVNEQQYSYSLSVVGPGSTFTAESDRPWISVTPVFGNIPGSLIATINVSSQFFPGPGTYTGTITVKDNLGNTAQTTVSLNISPSTALTVDPSSITIRASSTDEGEKTYIVTVSGGGGSTFTASSNQPWISVYPASGNIPGQLRITVNVSSQFFPGPGTYNGTVTVRDNLGNTATVAITLTISPPTNLTVSPSNISIKAYSIDEGEKKYIVTVSGGGGSTFTASSNQPWISVYPASGNIPGQLEITVNVSSQFFSGPGTYNGTVTVRDNLGNTATVAIKLTISPPTNLTVSPSNISIKAYSIDEGEKKYIVTVSGGGGSTFTASSNQPWISVYPASGNIPGQLEITVNVSSQFFSGPGTYNGTVTVRDNLGNTATVSIQLTILSPNLVVSPTDISITATSLDEGTRSYQVNISGAGTSFVASSDRPWIMVTPTGSIPGQLTVTVNISSQFFSGPGTYNGTVTVRDNLGNTATVAITLTISLPTDLTVSPSTIEITAYSLDEGEKTYTVTVSGKGNTFVASPDKPWISVSPASDKIPGQLKITVNISSQFFSGPGTYNGTVTVRDNIGNSAQVKITLTISPTTGLTVSPSNITIRAYSLDEGKKEYTVTVSGGGGSTFTAHSNQPWISVSPASGEIPGQLTITVDISPSFFSGPGTYSGQVIVMDNLGNQASVSVQVTIGGGGEEELVISPTSVSLTLYLLPGESSETYTLTFTITGLKSTYVASSDVPWLKIENPTGNIPGTLKVNISLSPTFFPKEGTFEGHISVSNNFGKTVTATITIKIVYAIPDKLVVTPNALTFRVTRANLSKITQTIKIENANYRRNKFRWSAEVVDSWITISPTSGEEATTVQLIINPAILTAGPHTGTVKFRSNLPTRNASDAEATLTITVVVSQPNELTVFPSYLFWSVERAEDGTITTLTSQVLHVYAGGYGFSLNYNVPWIDILFLNPASGESPKSLATSQSEGVFSITPQTSVLQSYGIGRYEGVITVVDRGSAFYREVPVIVEIRKAGDPISLPVSQPTFSQMAPGFIMVDATDAHSLHMILHVDDNLSVYSTAEACTASGGTWLDPFIGQGSSGTGLPYCSESEKVYVLLTAPQKQPNKVYAYTPVVPDKYLLVYQNGQRVNEDKDPFFSVGPIPEASFGPMLLAGLKGQMFISIRAGKDVESTREIQEVQVNINTLEGEWVVSENYQGKTYTYGADRLLTLRQNPDGMTYSGTWGTTPVTASISDGKTLLYKIEFMEGGIVYEYWVTSLTATQMKGKWRFSYKGDSSNWETFSAERTNGSIGGGGNPFNN